MYIRHARLYITVVFTGILVWLGCTSENDHTILRLGHGMSPSHPVSVAMVDMAERVDNLSGGAMEVRIYPSEQLGTEQQMMELLQLGSLDMTKTSSSPLEGFANEYRVFGLPYIFRDDEHRFAVLEGEIGQEILLSSEDVWLRGLTYYDAGSRSFYTVGRPIREPDDLRGLNIRVQESPAAIDLINILGGTPTPISFGELYTALQQGVVDGAENNPPSLHSTRHYELIDYYSLDEHTAPPDVLLISTHSWQRLTYQEQEWLQQAADSSFEVQKELWIEAEEEALRVVVEAGVEIIEPDQSLFAEAAEPLYTQYEQQRPQVFELLERIRKVETGEDN